MSLIKVEQANQTSYITLNRPEKRNALNRELIDQLHQALLAAGDDHKTYWVVLRGEGPMFSAGMDYAELSALADDPSGIHQLRHQLLTVWNLCEQMPKPTICQIHGGCIGGAVELALACDLRVADNDSVIGLPETRIGLIPDVGGCSRLASIIGVGRAKELILTGRMIDAEEAYSIGLVNRVARDAELSATTDELIAELNCTAPLAVGAAKQIIDSAAKPAFSATLAFEGTAQAACAASQDYSEGIRALAEKRPAKFEGK